MLNRYQVKTKAKVWNDPGPDLLRTKDSAIAQAVELLEVGGPWDWRKQRADGTWFDWKTIGDRRDVKAFLDEVLPTQSQLQVGQLGRATATGTEPKVIIRARHIDVPDLTGGTARAETTHALVRTRFPDIKFAGCYVCKRIEGTSLWSDHAWGDAVDETENAPAGVHNDDVTDWCVRMAKAGLMPIAQVLGSANGKVVNAEASTGWVVRPGGADDSHLWHVHMSCRIHAGETPPCA